METNRDSDSEWVDEESASEAESDASEPSCVPDDDDLTGLAVGDGGGQADAPTAVDVLRLEGVVCCSKMCLTGKRDGMTKLLASLKSMSKDEHRVSLFTTLAMCTVIADEERPSKRQRGAAPDKPTRERFAYSAPFVGTVCKSAFELLYGVSHRTLHLYRKRVRSGEIAAKAHGGTGNQNHKELDADMLVNWFADFAQQVGDVVPVRVRLKAIEGSRTRRYYSMENYTLLPHAFTWESLRMQYITFLDEAYIDTIRPSATSFQRILQKRAPTVRIRSPRDQVCDQCAIYRVQMGPDPVGQQTEVFGEHLADAKAMRYGSFD
jgi:hypothetical protein